MRRSADGSSAVHPTSRPSRSSNARWRRLLRAGGSTRAVKKIARSRSDKTIVSCSAIVRRADFVSAVMQKPVSLRRPLGQGLRRLVDPKPELFFPKLPVGPRWHGHERLQQNVRQTDQPFRIIETGPLGVRPWLGRCRRRRDRGRGRRRPGTAGGKRRRRSPRQALSSVSSPPRACPRSSCRSRRRRGARAAGSKGRPTRG
jgi:hypothetical protein